MPARCIAMVTSVLRDLGHDVPNDAELANMLKKAVSEIKDKEGLSNSNSDLRLAAIERD